ncbi:hypothetical protein FBU30_010675 [Linnemannia zychae]|nr:hypothetical protein FBU30_010675 [Linnemannia zychae]
MILRLLHSRTIQQGQLLASSSQAPRSFLTRTPFSSRSITKRLYSSPTSGTSSVTSTATSATVTTANSAEIPKKLTKFRQYAEQFKNKPASHLISFGILHEITAIVPLPIVYFALVETGVKIPFPEQAIEEGNRFVGRVAKYYGWDLAGADGARTMLNMATSYAVVKYTLMAVQSAATTTDTVLVNIPNRPSVRSVSSYSSISSTETVSSSHLAANSVDDVVYRHGRIEDAPLMTEMQFSNYLFHYHKFLPRKFLDNLDYPAMTSFHAKRMTPPIDEREMAYVVAERRNAETGEWEPVGMSQSMVPWWDRAYNHRWNKGWSQESFDCEIDTLYVKIGVQGGGIGRKLILGALQEAYDRFNMRKGVIIWTLVANTQAREFYKRIGCEEAGFRTLDLSDYPAECVGYAFRSVGEAIGK